jgi:DNA-binding transcriptional LysR family regulator
MNITSRQLKAFVLTARNQSFSRAAEQLFITQSGMSVLVRELESQLGFRLFERTTRKVTLTEFGSRFLPVADRSLRELEAAAANLSRSAAAANDCLSIGAGPFSAAEIMPQAIRAYTTLHPELHIRLIDAEDARLIEMVQSGKIDVALTASQQELPGMLKRLLARFALMLICPDDGSCDLPLEVRWSDVAARRLIGLPRDFPIQHLVDEQLARAGRHTPPEAVCNFLETQIAMVEAGAGAAVIPTSAAAACAKRRITMHAIVEPVVWSDFFWVFNRARKLSACAEDFSAFLKDYLGHLSDQWPARRALDAAYCVIEVRKAASGSCTTAPPATPCSTMDESLSSAVVPARTGLKVTTTNSASSGTAPLPKAPTKMEPGFTR